MNLIPYDAFTIEVNDSVEVVAQRLRIQTERSWWGLVTLPYVGKVWGDGFKVVPVTWYRNSFKPVICGELESTPTGTLAYVTMRPSWHALVFVFAWCAMEVVATLSVLESVIAGKDSWAALFA